MTSTEPSRSRGLDWGLLVRNPHFRHVFIARSISLLGLGFLAVAVPLQVFQLSGDSAMVGVAIALEGGGMFVGLLAGGVLADRHDRRRLILWARTACGLGFVGLALNAGWPHPGALALTCALAAWDGLFGAIGVTALLAAMPQLVGRESLLQARALSMLSMRLASVGSPALGGVLIAAWGVDINYLLAAAATGLTWWPLRKLPVLLPAVSKEDAGQHPLRALADGLRCVRRTPVVAAVVIVGSVVTFTTAVRTLFPVLAQEAYGGGAFELGLMYSAVPLGAAASAGLSRWAEGLARPGFALQLLGLCACACLTALAVNRNFVLALVLLALFGALVSLAGLLQYALVQGHTPDAYLGRVNGLWTAQDAVGDSLGSIAVGALAQGFSPRVGMALLGATGMVLGAGALLGLPSLRRAAAEAESIVRRSSAD